MFGEQPCRGKTVTIPCYKECNRFIHEVEWEVTMETLLEGVREEDFIKKETLEPSLERFLRVWEDVSQRGKRYN